MIDALVTGRLVGKSVARTASNGNAYVTFKLRVPTANGEAQFVSVIAFAERIVEALRALDDGDCVSLSGELSIGEWTDASGKIRPQIKLTAHAAITPFHVQRRRRVMQQLSVFADDDLSTAFGTAS